MAAYIVVQISVHDPVKYDDYRKMVGPTVDAYGGRFLARGGRVETLEGEWDPGRLVIIEFADMERARAWWSSEAYEIPKSLRQQASKSRMILVEGV